ncbi:MAG TPA: PepSY-associated TM helix domain-containing protein [Bradyrhizobium sp.]|nr:PepSY-associated TM helix domain-containing protein [Bradyrhizobium sp.]
MTKTLLLKLHRWTSLVFALPLLAIMLTGLILAFEPMVQHSGLPHSVDATRVIDLLKRYDPDGKARGVFINAAAQRLRFQGPGALQIDLASGETVAPGLDFADIIVWARFNHERLLGQHWLVVTSTVAMLVLMMIGIAMGLPRLRNNLAGWHKGAAWFTLPAILLCPVTALGMALGLTLSGSPPAPQGKPLSLPDAVRVVAQSRDLASVISIGSRGGTMTARIYDGGELRLYSVAADGLTALPRNWPRLIHEGNGAVPVTSLLNVLVSLTLLTLLVTGIARWWTRGSRLKQVRRDNAAVALKSAA